MELDKQTRFFLEGLKSDGPSQFGEQSIEDLRAGVAGLLQATSIAPAQVGATEDISFPGPDCEIAVRVYRPEPAGGRNGGHLRPVVWWCWP